MSKTAILVEDIREPDMLVDGVQYDLFCEIETKDKTFQSLYIQEGGTAVFVKTGFETAIVGLFSIEESNLRQLFDYLEAIVSKQDGLICYESEAFPRLLNLSTKLGGKYPILQDNLKAAPLKAPRLTNLLRQLRPQHPLDKELQKQILDHTVPIAYGIEEELDLTPPSSPKRNEEKASLSEVVQAASQHCENVPQSPLPSHSQDNKER